MPRTIFSTGIEFAFSFSLILSCSTKPVVLCFFKREKLILGSFGIFAGVVLGIILHRFVILTCEIDMIMFGRSISAKSYVYSVLLTCLFSILVNGGMFFKLRKIDMVESLKSAE